MDWSKYIDLDTALARVRGNKTIYRKMLQLFTSSTEFAALEEALAAKDYEKVDAVAHAIKGMTGNLGFTPLFDTSVTLMLEARAGAVSEATEAAYHEALAGTRAAVDALNAEWDGA